MLQAHGATDRGRVRPTNEDYFATDESLQLCVLADGMGGHKAGEIAARIAVDAVAEFVADARNRDHLANVVRPFGHDRSLSAAGNLLRTAIQLANAHVIDLARTSDAYAGMGTTIAAALVVDGLLSIGSVGDSRAYMFADGRLRQLTRDDSWMASILAHDPDVNPSALQLHPLRNALTNVVGAHPRTEVHIVEERLRGGELMLFSTDGVHDVLEDAHLEQLLAHDSADLAGIAARVVRAAIAHGSRDNCTAVVARYTPD